MNSAYAAGWTDYRMQDGMLRTAVIWMRDHGGLALLVGGMVIYIILLVLDLSVGWRLAYPYNIGWVGVVALPAAGIALLYLQTGDDGDDGEDGEYDRRDKGEMK
tara:strand:- start:776 stop:1087 length:312 start_codon:yes stop_codon:yes gene_type:complete